MFLKIQKQEKYAFIAAIITAFVAYGYRIANNFLTYDSMWNLYSDQNMISSGRQFLMYACKISSDYNLPWLNGLLAFFYLAVTAIVLVRLFDVKSNVAAALVGAIVASFPSVSNVFAYMFTVDGYMLAVLLATIAVYLATKYKYGFIPAAILVCFSIGIYQAYFAYAMVLIIAVVLLDLIYEDDIKKILFRILRYGITVVGGYILYLVSLKIMLSVQGESLSGYQGSDKVISGASFDLIVGIKTAYRSFKEFVMYQNVLTTTWPMKIAFVGIALLGAFGVVYAFVQKKRYKDWYRIALCVVLAAVTPVCATIFAVLSPDTFIHLLIRIPWVVFFILAIVIAEKVFTELKCGKYLLNAGYILTVVLVFQFALVSNIVGFNMNERYEKTYAMCVRIVDKLESQEGYRHGMKVAILGGFPTEDSYPSTDITRSDLIGYFGVADDLCVNSTSKYAEFMKHYLDVTITTVSDEEEIALTETEGFKDMEYFPYAGSIKLIGDVWVIKLNG